MHDKSVDAKMRILDRSASSHLPLPCVPWVFDISALPADGDNEKAALQFLNTFLFVVMFSRLNTRTLYTQDRIQRTTESIILHLSFLTLHIPETILILLIRIHVSLPCFIHCSSICHDHNTGSRNGARAIQRLPRRTHGT